MPVNTLHKQVADMLPSWNRVSHCKGGQRRIKAERTTYLPMLAWKRKKDEKYAAYLFRALFENIVGNTHDGIVGLVFCEPPEVTVPKFFEPRLQDITLTGVPFALFAIDVFSQVVAPGRCGILADMARDTAAAGPPKPYLAIYGAQNITNWKTTRIEGRRVLTRLNLYDPDEEEDPADPFVMKQVEQYRVVELVDGIMQHQLWRKSGKPGQEDWVRWGDPIVPERRKVLLDFCPWVFCNPSGQQPEVDEPPLLAVADINLSMYLNSADLEQGRHKVSIPTPWIFGSVPEGDDVELGSALTGPNPDTKVGMLEVAGPGLGALERAIAEKREQAAANGARLLEKQKRAAETAEALRLRQSGERSVVATMAENVSRALTKALTYCVWWAHGSASLEEIEKQVKVTLNTKFEQEILSPQDALAMAQTWQLGGMSKRSYVWNLKNGNRLPPDTTVEEELAMIEMEAAQRGMGAIEEGEEEQEKVMQ